MSGVSTKVLGADDVRALFAGIQDAFNVEKVADESSAILLNRIRQRFLQQKAPDGSSWATSEASRSRRSGRGGGTLFDTGALFHSIGIATNGTRGERRIEVDPNARNKRSGILVRRYARVHQTGTGGAPQRKFMGFANDDIKVVKGVILDRLRRVSQ